MPIPSLLPKSRGLPILTMSSLISGRAQHAFRRIQGESDSRGECIEHEARRYLGVLEKGGEAGRFCSSSPKQPCQVPALLASHARDRGGDV